ncbi:MAG: AAA family ATPase [Methylococcales bacterium]
MQNSAIVNSKKLYGFRDMPFSPTVNDNPNFIFLSQNHKSSLANLANSINNSETLTLILGVKGVGKSTFIDYACKHVLQNFSLGRVNGQIKTAHELLRQTLSSFGHEVKYLDTSEMLVQLRDVLIAKFEQQNRRPSLLVIDDANFMYLDALKGVELLLGLNADGQLLQLILVGQPELNDLFNVVESHGLSTNARVLIELEALTAEESLRYINHRLSPIGVVDKKLSDESVLLAIYHHSGGIPKKINAICDELVLRSSAQRTYEVSTPLNQLTADTAVHQRPLQQEVMQYKLRLRVEPNNKPVSRFSISRLLTGLVLSGVVLALVFVWGSFFSALNGSQIEISRDGELSSVKHQFVNQIKAPAQISQQTNHPETLLQNKRSSDNSQENKITASADSERHRQALHPTTPDGQSALDIYRNILSKDPDNVSAIQGINRIAKQYIELAEDESRQGAIDKASHYLEQAAAIIPESETIQNLSVQADKLHKQQKTVQIEILQSQPAAKPTNVLTVDEKVNNLLALAEQQFADSKLVSPENDNAYATYKSVLLIIPNEKRALQGLKKISSHYLDQAKKLHSNGNLNSSKLMIAQGLNAFPDHQELALLKQQLSAEFKLETQNNKINTLLIQAEQQIVALKFIQPPNDNAYQTSQKIAAIDDNNSQVIQGLQKIQSQLIVQIQKTVERKDYRAALEIANQILSVPSDHVDESFYQQAIFTAVKTKQVVNNHLDNLLSLAKKQRKAQRFSKPAGDNALESYRRVLDISPVNVDAKTGLSKLTIEYQLSVRAALSEGSIDQALALANEGLKVFPDNKDLLVLHDDVLLHRDLGNMKVDASLKKESGDHDRGLRSFGTF